MSETKKQSLMPVVFKSILLTIVITIVVISYESIKLFYDDTVKEKSNLEREYEAANSFNKVLHAEYDKYTSEDNILPVAINDLKMIPQKEKRIIIIDRNQANKIEKMEADLNRKYEL